MYTIIRPPSTILRCLYSPIQFFLFIYDFNQLATLKKDDCSLKSWEEGEINLAKKQAKNVKVSPKEKNGYRKFTESLQKRKNITLTGEKAIISLSNRGIVPYTASQMIENMRVDEEHFTGIFWKGFTENEKGIFIY